ncbi:hypothetical protein HK105_209062 [Polyrhizophydium stewartii]|uniref:Uncharacterized protein n=1 Tax=Polyrhizophydium stewartii TaxID=2732419 RepID=A0ABR4MW01_9FUNG
MKRTITAAATLARGRTLRMAAACDGDTAQAACELRWLADAVLQRRVGSVFVRQRVGWPPARASEQAVREPLGRSLRRLRVLAGELAACGSNGAAVEAFVERHLAQHELQRLDRWIWQRTDGHKPLQFVLGSQPFGGLEIRVRPPTLIPRWETEEWVERLAADIAAAHAAHGDSPRPLRILELCSGSGCISLLLAHTLQHLAPRIVAVDVAQAAVLLARANQRRLGIDTASGLDFVCGDITDDSLVPRLLGLSPPRASTGGNVDLHQNQTGFDVIVANPPYIPPHEYAALDPSVAQWEDRGALLAPDSRGICFFERIEQMAAALLAMRGSGPRPHVHATLGPHPLCESGAIPRLVFEMGHAQGVDVAR